MCGGRGGFGGVDGEREAGVGDHVDAFVGEFEVADDGVVKELLGAGAVEPDVVRAPPAAEVLAAGGQLADEVVQVLVVGVAAGFGAQDGDAGVGGGVPVGVEVGARRRRGRCSGRSSGGRRVAVVQRGVHGPAEVVGGEQVHPAVADDGRRGDRVEHPLQARPRCPARLGRRRGRIPALVPSAAWARWNRWARSASSSCRARAIASSTEAETPAEGAALQLGVVLDADPGEGGDLTAAQPGHPALPISGRPACCGVILARREIRNSRTSARLSTRPSTVRRLPGRWDALSVHLSSETPTPRAMRVPESGESWPPRRCPISP